MFSGGFSQVSSLEPDYNDDMVAIIKKWWNDGDDGDTWLGVIATSSKEG